MLNNNFDVDFSINTLNNNYPSTTSSVSDNQIYNDVEFSINTLDTNGYSTDTVVVGGDHDKLYNKNLSNQHTIGAITNLQSVLDNKIDVGSISVPNVLDKVEYANKIELNLKEDDEIISTVELDPVSTAHVGLMTPSQRAKLNSIEEGAESNKINVIAVNNTPIFPQNKVAYLSVPTSTSQLINDDHTVKDANYTHTDNNFTDAEKLKLDTSYSKEGIDTLFAQEVAARTSADNTISSNLTAHTSNANNPHSVTKSQIGLGNVDNTSDLGKPISTATQAALDVESAARIENDTYILNAVTTEVNARQAADTALQADIDTHKNSKNNPHQVTKSQVGLGNVNNTADLDKPISTATQTALNNKVDKVSGKQLSTNDFTTAEKNKLEGIEAGAQVNTVSSVNTKTGNVILSTSDLANNSGYINKEVSDLTNYRLSSDQDDIDASLQSDIDTEVSDRATAISNEQTARQNADTALQDSINTINGKIPGDASTSNQLADKNFVNSSIATNTAVFRGTFNLINDLQLPIDATNQQIATALATKISIVTNNDYSFVSIPDITITSQIKEYRRFKYVASNTSWEYEYTLNNSSFTATQWSAINSTINSTKVSAYDDHLVNVANPHNVTKAQVGLGNVDNTSDSAKPISTATQTALNTKVDKVNGKGLSENDFTSALKTKLENIEAGAQVNTVIKVNNKIGDVVLKTSDLTNDSGYITSSYHDNTKEDIISDLDTIRSGAALGATAYQKPTTGISEADLSSSVNASLDLADSALQSVPSTYRTAAAQDAIDAGKQDKLISGTNIKTINNTSILGSGNIVIDSGSVFMATYNSTSFNAMKIAYNAGKQIIMKHAGDSGDVYALMGVSKTGNTINGFFCYIIEPYSTSLFASCYGITSDGWFEEETWTQPIYYASYDSANFENDANAFDNGAIVVCYDNAEDGTGVPIQAIKADWENGELIFEKILPINNNLTCVKLIEKDNGTWIRSTVMYTIPTKTSDLTNDGDGTNPFLTQHQSLSDYRTSAAQDIIDQSIREVAEGRKQTYVVSYETNPIFNTQADSINISGNSVVDINGSVIRLSDVSIGDTFYVSQLGVPDRWVRNYLYGSLLDVPNSRIGTVGRLQEDGSYLIQPASLLGIWTPGNEVVFNGDANKTYRMSGYVKSSATTANICLGWRYSDGSIEMCGQRGVHTSFYLCEGVSAANKTVTGIAVYYNGSEEIYIKDLGIYSTDPTERTGYTLSKVEASTVDLSLYRTSSAQDVIDNSKENITNKVTAISSSSTNTQYPSAKAVYDSIPSKTSQLTNDSGFLTAHQDISGKADLVNGVIPVSQIPQIPESKVTNLVSDLQNIREVAEGLKQTYVVKVSDNPTLNSQNNKVTSTANLLDIDGKTITLSSLKLGDTIYITDTDVPDRWVGRVGQNGIIQLFYQGDIPNNFSCNMLSGTSSISNGVLTMSNSNGIYKEMSMYSRDTTHKYLISYTLKADSNTTAGFGFGGRYNTNAWNITTEWATYVSIITINNNDVHAYVYVGGSGINVYAKNLMIFDLTAMYGAGLEPTTYEAFKADYPLDYYQFNTSSETYSADFYKLETSKVPIVSISKNGVNIPAVNSNVDITIPTKTSDLTNDSGFLTQHQSLANYSTTAEMNTAISNHHDSTKADASTTYTKSETDAAISSYHDSTKADVSSLATVATSGSYNDLTNTPVIPDISGKEDKGKLTINGTQYEVITSTVDVGTEGYITFVLEA